MTATVYDLDPTCPPNKTPSPVVWFLKEGTERGGGLDTLSIACLTKDIAIAYADKRAGRLLEIGRQQGIDQGWQDYGNLPRGRDYVRQVCEPWGPTSNNEASWQHVTLEYVVTNPEEH